MVFSNCLANLSLVALLCCCAGVSPMRGAVGLDCGPFVGHVDASTARIWARVEAPGTYYVRLEQRAGRVGANAVAEHDLCVVWRLEGLQPDTGYRYSIANAAGEAICGGPDYNFRTAPADDDDDAVVRLFFGSCAKEDGGTAATWRRVAEQGVDVVVLLGDTPYIDSSELTVQRTRHAAFARVPEMAALLRSTPYYATWDDHDFGLGDGDGRLRGKANSRRAFVEYHANPGYGANGRGIYTSFRRGPVEVFLLDTRYFAATEPSPFLLHRASLLGQEQWAWLFEALAASTAPVKVLACGMIWNGATRPNKQDHWGSYPHEFDALLRFIGERKISGVVLVGGDIHRSRVLRHDTGRLAGYDLVELISSPMHSDIIEAANAPHPGLIRDMGTPHTFLLLDAEQRGGALTRLRARFVDASGDEHFAIDLLDN